MSELIVNETGYPGAIKQEIVDELVRCRECLYYAGKQYGEYGRCDRNHTWMRTDSYCSEGVRRNG